MPGQIEEIYKPIVGCPLRCEGIIRDDDTNIPRGFFTEANPGDKIAIMVVALNPGQPMSVEAGLYKNGDDLAKTRAHLDLVRKAFLSGEGKTFHERLLTWIAEILEIEKSEIFRQVVYTNLVKCTTPGNKKPSRQLGESCFGQNLKYEIARWKPLNIIALGKSCFKALLGLSVDCLELPHPSHRRDRNYHIPFVAEIKKKLRN